MLSDPPTITQVDHVVFIVDTMKCHKFSSKFFLENSFLRPNCKVENIFWPSVCSTLLIYSKASKQSPWFTKIVKVLVLKNKLLHLHFHRGHFLPNSYTVFGETSKNFSIESCLVVLLTEIIGCSLIWPLLGILSFLDLH